MKDSNRTFVPAAGRDLFLPLYDPFVKLLGVEKARLILLDQAGLRAGMRVLDIGCGTGSLVVLMKQRFPEVDVAGIDPDPKALSRARRKAGRAGVVIQLDRAFSDHLPHPEATFDRVFSTLMFHHLESNEKAATLAEIFRVLKPGGSLHLLDFAGPAHGEHSLMRLFHSHGHLRDNTVERIVSWMAEVGMPDAAKIADGRLFLLRTSYFRATRPPLHEP